MVNAAGKSTSGRSGGQWARRWRAWLTRHSYSLFSSIGGLMRNKLGTLMTVVVLGIALLLPLGLYTVLDNMRQLDRGWRQIGDITVFMQADTDGERVSALSADIAAWPSVSQVDIIDPGQAMTEFRDQSRFGDVLSVLDENPLPYVLVVSPASAEIDSSVMSALLRRIESQPDVDFAQFDLQWLNRLNAMLGIAAMVARVLTGLFGIAVIFVVGNTIRLDIQNRREEIQVLTLVGAADAFVRRPFLYTGLWYGLMGGLLALLLMYLVGLILYQPVETLAVLYDSEFKLYLPGPGQAGLVLLASGILGLFGAWLSVRRHLKTVNIL